MTRWIIKKVGVNIYQRLSDGELIVYHTQEEAESSRDADEVLQVYNPNRSYVDEKEEIC